MSVNHEKIVEHVTQNGKNSHYATSVCPYSGLTAVHACAINGYLGLLKVSPAPKSFVLSVCLVCVSCEDELT